MAQSNQYYQSQNPQYIGNYQHGNQPNLTGRPPQGYNLKDQYQNNAPPSTMGYPPPPVVNGYKQSNYPSSDTAPTQTPQNVNGPPISSGYYPNSYMKGGTNQNMPTYPQNQYPAPKSNSPHPNTSLRNSPQMQPPPMVSNGAHTPPVHQPHSTPPVHQPHSTPPVHQPHPTQPLHHQPQATPPINQPPSTQPPHFNSGYNPLQPPPLTTGPNPPPSSQYQAGTGYRSGPPIQPPPNAHNNYPNQQNQTLPPPPLPGQQLSAPSSAQGHPPLPGQQYAPSQPLAPPPLPQPSGAATPMAPPQGGPNAYPYNGPTPTGASITRQPSSQPYPGAPPSGLSHAMNKMDLNDAERPINLMQEKNILPPHKLVENPLRFETSADQGMLIPPNRKNCSPSVFRSTLKSVPHTQNLLNKVKLPFGLVIHPFKDLSSLPVISAGTIVRCKRCRTYINPFVSFLQERKWRCNMCFTVNDTAEEFLHHPVTKTYGEPHTRPECTNSTIEFIGGCAGNILLISTLSGPLV